MKETWKDIKNYEGYYQVSDLGRVKSMSRYVDCINGHKKFFKQRIRTLTYDRGGYLQLKLIKKGNYECVKVHQLVAMVFLGHIRCGHKLIVNHINNVKTDNRAINLNVITQRENCYTHKKGTSKYIGVSFCRTLNKWISQIYIKDKNIRLGVFNNEKIAAAVYQYELEKHHELQS